MPVYNVVVPSQIGRFELEPVSEKVIEVLSKALQKEKIQFRKRFQAYVH